VHLATSPTEPTKQLIERRLELKVFDRDQFGRLPGILCKCNVNRPEKKRSLIGQGEKSGIASYYEASQAALNGFFNPLTACAGIEGEGIVNVEVA